MDEEHDGPFSLGGKGWPGRNGVMRNCEVVKSEREGELRTGVSWQVRKTGELFMCLLGEPPTIRVGIEWEWIYQLDQAISGSMPIDLLPAWPAPYYKGGTGSPRVHHITLPFTPCFWARLLPPCQ